MDQEQKPLPGAGGGQPAKDQQPSGAEGGGSAGAGAGAGIPPGTPGGNGSKDEPIWGS